MADDFQIPWWAWAAGIVGVVYWLITGKKASAAEIPSSAPPSPRIVPAAQGAGASKVGTQFVTPRVLAPQDAYAPAIPQGAGAMMVSQPVDQLACAIGDGEQLMVQLLSKAIVDTAGKTAKYSFDWTRYKEAGAISVTATFTDNYRNWFSLIVYPTKNGRDADLAKLKAGPLSATVIPIGAVMIGHVSDYQMLGGLMLGSNRLYQQALGIDQSVEPASITWKGDCPG